MSTNVTTTTTTTTEAAVAAYHAATGAEKVRIRNAAQTAANEAMLAADAVTAMAWLEAMKAMTVTTSTVEVDYVARIADHRATLVAAIARIDEGDVTMPSGVEVPSYEAADVMDGTPGSTDGLVRITGRKAGRGSVADWVASVVTDEAATVAQLRARWTATDDYPKSAPSAGAIAAMLDRLDGGAHELGFAEINLNGKRGVVSA